MDLEVLLPCPFCGNPNVELVAYNQIHHDDECECFSGNDDHWAVNCDASGNSIIGYKPGCGATAGSAMGKAEAIELWNKRAHSAGVKPE